MLVSTIVARIDADDKFNFNASVAVNLFIKTVLREKRILFNISGKTETSLNLSEAINEVVHHD